MTPESRASAAKPPVHMQYALTLLPKHTHTYMLCGGGPCTKGAAQGSRSAADVHARVQCWGIQGP
jgi:hypothetical protein